MISPSAAAVLAPSLERDLARLLGAGAVLTDPDRLLVYESDGLTRYRQRPLAVVLPRDTESCASAVSLLHGAGIATVPRGAGTGLSGGAVAAQGTVVVGTARMNRILEVDGPGRRARVQAGVVNADLTAAVAPLGLAYAPDPSSQSACTLGGNVAENSGGPHCLKYGVTSRYVTGLTVVGPQGRIVNLTRRPASGDLDLVGLFVGSEGCFGLATEMELTLIPAPAAARTLLAAFHRTDDAGSAVTAILGDGLVPAALEIVDGSTIRAVEASVYAAGYPADAGAALVVEFDGPEAGLDRELERAAELCRNAGAWELRTASSDEERAGLWKGRKKAFGAMGRLAPDLLVQDATVPRSRLPQVLRQVDEIARRWDLRVANVFHAGDGNLHPNLLFDRRDAEQVERVERASREIMEACVAVGGTITGEHGVGLDKRDYMPLVHGPDELEAMDAVRRVFDPSDLFNPGKVLPPAPEAPARPPGRRAAVTGSTPHAFLEGEGVETEVAGAGTSVALPRDTDQVCRVLSRASAEGWRVGVEGAGTRNAGLDLVVSTRRLQGIEAHEVADLTVAAGAGTSLAALQDHLAAAGQWVAVDGPGLGERSMGSLVARGDALALAAAFGAVRDQVLGLTLVTGDGRALRLGGAVVKNVAGFDLVRLAVGSRGRLGVVTRVALRTHPLPRAEGWLSVRAPDAAALAPAVAGVLEAPFLPASAEAGVGEGGAELLVRVVGSEALVDHALEALQRRIPGEALVLDATEGRRRQSRLRAPAAGAGRPFHGRPSASGFQELLSRSGEAADRDGVAGNSAWALPDQGLLWREGVSAPAPVRGEGPQALERGLRVAFDPHEVLVGSPGRWGAV